MFLDRFGHIGHVPQRVHERVRNSMTGHVSLESSDTFRTHCWTRSARIFWSFFRRFLACLENSANATGKWISGTPKYSKIQFLGTFKSCGAVESIFFYFIFENFVFLRKWGNIIASTVPERVPKSRFADVLDLNSSNWLTTWRTSLVWATHFRGYLIKHVFDDIARVFAYFIGSWVFKKG